MNVVAEFSISCGMVGGEMILQTPTAQNIANGAKSAKAALRQKQRSPCGRIFSPNGLPKHVKACQECQNAKRAS